MKITQRQLRRMIKEATISGVGEVRPDRGIDPEGGWKEGDDPEDDLLGKAAAGLTDDDLYFGAMSDLEEELKNAIAIAIDRGLIIDDIEDAWSEAKLYIEDA